MVGYIYVIGVESDTAVKIGWAKNPSARLSHLQTGSPASLKILKTYRCDTVREALATERKMHKILQDKCDIREWFVVDLKTVDAAFAASYAPVEAVLHDIAPDVDPIDALKAWLDKEGHSISWLARETGWTREMLSYVINKHKPMSRKLARVIEEKTGLALRKSLDDSESGPVKGDT